MTKTGDAPLFPCKRTPNAARRRRGDPHAAVVGRWGNRGASPVVLCLVALLGPAGCGPKTPPTPAAPPDEVPGAFSRSGDEATEAKWWLVFGDDRLNVLVAQALSDNPGLQSTWARLAQARAAARRAGAETEPALTGEASASRTRIDAPPGKGSMTVSDLALGLAVSYEVDLWGRVRSSLEEAKMDVRAGRADLDAAAITLTARVADTWCRLLDSQAQIALIDEQIATNRKYLEIISLRARRRQANAIDELQQAQRLATTRSQRIQAESARQVLAHELAVLVGKPPAAALPGVAGPLPKMPPMPRTGVPADVLRRRPDVRAAAFRLAGAHHAVAAAAADRFPRVSLSGRLETSGDRTRELFNNWLAMLAANLTAPILDGGSRAAEAERTRAAAEQALHDYGQAVLTALREVEDALVRERHQADFLASLIEQLKLSDKIIDQSMKRYIGGTVNYLRVLDALRSHQVLQRQILTARLNLLRNRITLYRALGGGWDVQKKVGSQSGRPTRAPGE